MLGQEIYTHEEFNTFLQEKFNPLKAHTAAHNDMIIFQKQEIEELKKNLNRYKILTIAAMLISIITVALTVL
jgi:hypothetical protein